MIDIHTHLWNPESIPVSIRSYFKTKKEENFEKASCGAEGLLERMDSFGLEKAVVAALAYGSDLPEKEISEINEYVWKETEKSRRLAAFCTVNPFLGKKAVDIVRDCIEEKDFKGLKLHGNLQQFYANDKAVYPLYELMQKYRRPVLFHTGGIGLEAYKDKYSALDCFDDIACDFPELPMILGHAGRYEYARLAVILRKHRNCYADISTNFSKNKKFVAAPLERLVEAVNEWAGDIGQLLFGSDTPFYGQKQTMEYIRMTKHKEQLHLALEKNTDEFCKKYKIF